MNIYVASSWRNNHQPRVVELLKGLGHEVYDFKNPAPGDNGFHWSEIDKQWKTWDGKTFRDGLLHDIAQAGFAKDMGALRKCDCCVLVLPSGRSAHLEAGWAAGSNRQVIVYIPPGEQIEPELMYLMNDSIAVTEAELLARVAARCPNCGHTSYHCPASGCNHWEPGPTLPDGSYAGTNWCDCESTEPGASPRSSLRLVGGAP